MSWFPWWRNETDILAFGFVILGGIYEIPDIDPDGNRSGNERNHKPILLDIEIPEFLIQLPDYLYFFSERTVDDVNFPVLCKSLLYYFLKKLQFFLSGIHVIPELIIFPVFHTIIPELSKEFREIDDERGGNPGCDPK